MAMNHPAHLLNVIKAFVVHLQNQWFLKNILVNREGPGLTVHIWLNGHFPLFCIILILPLMFADLENFYCMFFVIAFFISYTAIEQFIMKHPKISAKNKYIVICKFKAFVVLF